MTRTKAEKAEVMAAVKAANTVDIAGQVLTFRVNGMSMDKIAERLGISITTANNAYHRAMALYVDQVDADEQRKLETERLDLLNLLMMNRVIGSKGMDDDAVSQVIKIIQLRSRIHGLVITKVDTNQHGERDRFINEINGFLTGAALGIAAGNAVTDGPGVTGSVPAEPATAPAPVPAKPTRGRSRARATGTVAS